MSLPQCLQAIASTFTSSAQKGHFLVSDWLSIGCSPLSLRLWSIQIVFPRNFLIANDFCQWLLVPVEVSLLTGRTFLNLWAWAYSFNIIENYPATNVFFSYDSGNHPKFFRNEPSLCLFSASPRWDCFRRSSNVLHSWNRVVDLVFHCVGRRTDSCQKNSKTTNYKLHK